MRKESKNYNLWQRLGAMVLAAVLVLGMLPANSAPVSAAATVIGDVTKREDPETLTRPQAIYGNNTLNAGKVTVGKSVSKDAITVDGHSIGLTDDNNFLITVSQSAQVMGLSTETSVPVDVVFVLDTSGSMNQNGVDRASSMVTAANSAIATLMKTNEQNRVAVVAFSSEGYGDGTSGDAAASVLSSLAHYTGEAATNHLQWVDSEGTVDEDGNYIAGRDQTTITVNNGPGSGQQRTVNAFRNGHDGGTNIQAGIVAGAKILTAVQDKTWTNPDTNETVTRIPFLIILSDGQPTFSYDDATWYDPTTTGDNAADEQGPGSSAYEGNGFIAALTAAYYKGKITEHYYGDSASADNHCFVYTMGVELDSLSGEEKLLAEITLDPDTYTKGTYAEANAASYWNYGNTAVETTKDSLYGWKTYWANYAAGSDFGIRVNQGQGVNVWVGEGEEGSGAPQRSDYRNDNEYRQAYREWYNENYDTVYPGQMYTVTADSIANSKKYVNGIGYTGGLAYNDDYFAADDVANMEAIFEELIAEISKKAISVPTKVTTGDHDFDGYVTFTDPLGQYMEVKAIKGFISNGQLYHGENAAQLMKSGTNDKFNEAIRNVLKTRLSLNDADDRFADENALNAFIDSLLATADGNSITWWGNEYPSGKDDHKVQVLAPAEDDSIAYLTAADTVIPEGAEYVCRSYFFGSAGSDQELDYLSFVVRVERSVKAPYQQTVVISAPASLLSVEKVMVNESFDDNGKAVYTASVEKSMPARVVYEVGLWDTINEETVSTIVAESYRNQTVNGEGQVNYDPATDTYYFFTNDWDRSEDNDHHHRALAKATFEAAADNPFYTYQEDTLLVQADGKTPVTTNPAGKTAYYVRTYYKWGETPNADGTYSATKETAVIEVEIPSNVNLTTNSKGEYYIPKGTYTASTLVVNGDDAEKTSNETNTALIVAHPHRTDEDDHNSSHYTVLLGNNGSISLKSNVPEPTKTVSNISTNITDANGKSVMVGDVLEYTITGENYGVQAGTLTITDTVPTGTEFVSAEGGVTPVNGKLTWTFENVAPGAQVTVKFRVRVTEAALDIAVAAIQNTATVQLNNSPAYETNTTSNPPQGKKVSIQGDATGTSVQVGDLLRYSIEYHNDTGAVADRIVITDKLPAGTVLVTDSHTGVYDEANHTLTWTFTNVPAGAGGVVTFTVQVDPSAVSPIENGATINIGNNNYTTNKTTIKLDKGNLTLKKTVVIPEGLSPAADTFTLTLSEGSGKLNGTYSGVTFVNGIATVQIQHGQTITIEGLAAGTTIMVRENAGAEFDVAYTNNGQAVIPVDGTASVEVTNTYKVSDLEVILQANKELQGGSPENETFGFTVVPCNAQGDTNGAEAIAAGQVTLTKDTKAITFSELVFSKPGTYHYLVSEVNGGETGVTYTAVQYLVTIVVVDNGNGTLGHTMSVKTRSGSTGAFADYTGTMLFTNEYKPLSTSVTLGGTKTLSGREMKADEFTFVVTENGNEVTTGTNDKNGNIAFKPITYTAAGTHTYHIFELDGKLSGVTYDQDSYTITVDVVDVDGQLVATVKNASGQIIAPENFGTTFTFENTFEPDEVAVTLKADKVLTGPTGTPVTLTEGQFSFVVRDLAGNQVASGTNKTDGTITFSSIEYFMKDVLDVTPDANGVRTKVFQYKITELKPDSGVDPSMYYDNLEIDVQVTVKYDQTTGILSVSAPVYSADTTFNNVDNPDFITVKPVGQKAVDADMPADARFSFSVHMIDESAANKLGAMVTSGVSDSAGKINFSEITYDFDDMGNNPSMELHYWIVEDQGGTTHAGITYDATRYLLKVDLSVVNNKLVAVPTYWALRDQTTQGEVVDPLDRGNYTEPVDAANVVFNNSYEVRQGTSVTMQVSKNLVGRDLQAGEFEFGLYHNGQLVALATNGFDDNGDGQITGNELNMVRFTRVYAPSVLGADQTSREIVYVIRELDNKVHGVDYSDALAKPVYVKVTVTSAGGVLLASAPQYSYAENGTFTDTVLGFTNTYTPDPAEVTFTGTKVLTGGTLQAGQFSFVVVDAASEVAWGSNAADGSITFSKIVYTYEQFQAADTDHDGVATFTYTIREVIPDIGVGPNEKYADNTYGITVTVSYDENTGKLTASTSSLSGVEFQNYIHPETAAVKPEGFKVLNGATNPLRFSFRVWGIGVHDGNAYTSYTQRTLEATGVSRIVNDDDSNKYAIDFTELVYDYDDVGKRFYYLIEEVSTAANGITYSTAQYWMIVGVTKDLTTNKLVPRVSYYLQSGVDGNNGTIDEQKEIPKDYVQFENTQNAVVKSLNILGTKNMEGKTLHDGMFDFRMQMLDDQGALVANSIVDGVNAANGTITFGTLIFTPAQLPMATASTSSTDATTGITTTVYEYHVLVSELKPANQAIPGVTYSTEQFIAVINWTETDNAGHKDYRDPVVAAIYEAELSGSGYRPKNSTNLLAGVNMTDPAAVAVAVKNALTFNNTYAVQSGTTVTLEVNKILANRDLEAGEFEFGLYHDGKLVATATNGFDMDGDGQITGEELGVVRFTRHYAPTVAPGEITYVIKELDNKVHGVDYSGALAKPIYAKVTVTDVNSALQASKPQYSYSQTGEFADTILSFENTYTPDPVEVALEANKELTGRDLVAGEFSFEVFDEEGFEVAWGTNGFDSPDDNDSVITGGELGKIVFSNLIYDFDDLKDDAGNRVTSKTFTYTVKEAIPDVGVDPNMYYDLTAFTVTVTVTYDKAEGKLEYEVTYPAEGYVFKNIQNPATVVVTPEGSKATEVISGNIPEDTQFSFTIYEAKADGTFGAVVGAGTSGIDGQITFSSLIYDSDDLKDEQGNVLTSKTFNYWIVEDNAGKTHAGITYDDTKYLMTVVLSRNVTNKLVIQVTYTNPISGGVSGGVGGGAIPAPAAETEVVFNNKYQVTEPVTVEITANKNLTGRDLRFGEFGFNLYHLHNGGENLIAATTNGHGQDIRKIFFSRTYAPSILLGEHGVDEDGDGTADGKTAIIYYVIREQVNNLGGVDYTQATPVYVKVIVTAGNNGTMTAAVSYHTDATCTAENEITNPAFANSYETADTTFAPEVYKVLDGRHMADDEFSFVVSDLSGTPVTYGLSKAADSGEAEAIVFNKIIYTYQQYISATKNADGDAVFRYKITEIRGNLVNVGYTDAVIWLQVTVHDNGDGTLSVSSEKYYTDDTFGTEITGDPTFRNTYTPMDTTVTLEAEKALLGREMVDGEFSFVVKSGDTVVATGGNVGNKVQFSGIGITVAMMDGAEVKDFVFSMEELKTSQGSMTFDSETYDAVVTVKNNLATGKLEVVGVTYFDGQNQLDGAPRFINEYKPADAKVEILVHKDLINYTLKKDMFIFEMKVGGQTIGQLSNDAHGNAVFELSYGISVLDGVQPDANNVRTKVFTYTISEVENTNTNENGKFHYDKSVYKITVTVTDDGKGGLTATVAMEKDQKAVDHVIFTNTFVPNPITVDLDTALGATKTIVDNEGNVLVREDVEFTFEVHDLKGGLVTTGTAKGKDAVDGVMKIDFGTFTFNVEGEYRYLITEKTTNMDGYVLDTTVWCAHILVRFDPDTGKLSVSEADVFTHILTAESHAEDGIQALVHETPAFVNVYDADDVQLHLTLDKLMTGDRTAAKEHEFAFQLLNEDGTIAGEARNHQDGKINFYLHYDLQDLIKASSRTFRYTVKEIIPSGAVKQADGTYVLNGITYDTKTYPVTVKLTDNGKGKLVATLNGNAASGTVDTGIDFVNKYTAKAVTVSFQALKRMEGMPLGDGIYTFHLMDGEKLVSTGTNKADGTIVFDKQLTFTKPGTYTYTMVEHNNAKPGVTFDKTSFKVTVEVTDNGKGSLEAKVTYTTDQATYDLPVFINIYQPTGAKVVIQAEKVLNGRDLQADEFTFVLLDSENKVIGQVKNKADGTIVFDALPFNEVGTHVYTIQEVKGNAGGMTYDETVYTVVVEITDPNFDGVLDQKVTYYLGDEVVESDEVIFTNTYKPAPTTVELAGKKELTGRDLVSGEFDFEVRDAEGNLITTGTNKAGGTIVFEDIVIETEMDLTLYVTEIKGDDNRIVYDDYTYRVKLVVTDEDGVLKADVEYLDGDIVFYNEYKVPANPPTGDDTPIHLFMGLMALSAMAMMAMLILDSKKRKHF